MAVACFGGYNIFRLSNAKTSVINGLDDSIGYLESGDYKMAVDMTDSVFEEWKRNERVLRIFTRRNYVDEIADILSELPALADEKNKSMFLAYVDKAKNMVEHIWENEIPAIDTLL